MGRGKRQALAGRAPAPENIALSDTNTRSRLAPPVSTVILDPPAPAVTSKPPVSSNPAANARQRKDQKPELYCQHCLWMTGGGLCPRHGGPEFTPERQLLARKRSSESITPEELERLYELAGLPAGA
jgi:hypothetical protein